MRYLMYFQYMLGQLSISENAKEWTKITEEYICFYFLSNNWFYTKMFFWPDIFEYFVHWSLTDYDKLHVCNEAIVFW